MTREELLSRLSKLLSSQFEQVLYLARIPTEHLPSPTAAQALRAVELMRYIEQQNQLEQLPRLGEALSGAPRLPREALDFAYERQRHAGFVGRAALLAQLDQQLIEEPA